MMKSTEWRSTGNKGKKRVGYKVFERTESAIVQVHRTSVFFRCNWVYMVEDQQIEKWMKTKSESRWINFSSIYGDVAV